jgi:Escherichia/Staphylococcus phage prohead protease
MEHTDDQLIRKEVAAATTIADQDLGQFTAGVSGWTGDRERDTIAPSAFNKAIQAWQASGKTLPILFNHSSEAVGYFDPRSMHATEDGLVASGQVDRDTDNGKMVWKQIKAGSMEFSIGFAGDHVPNEKGGKHWTEIDLLEISATSVPMHPVTRTLSWKSAAAAARPRRVSLLATAR